MAKKYDVSETYVAQLNFTKLMTIRTSKVKFSSIPVYPSVTRDIALVVREEIAVDEWSIENINKCAERQKEILENAVKLLKDGGYIVYATCTFSLEENEMVIDNFLNLHPDFEIIRVKESVESNTENGIFFDGCICENINYARRFYPHKNKGEGQFMAVLRNKSVDTYNQKLCNSKSEKIDKIVYDFLRSILFQTIFQMFRFLFLNQQQRLIPFL